jgi:hypothetical protein
MNRFSTRGKRFIHIVTMTWVVVHGGLSFAADEKDVTWCLTGNATYRIDQQPMRAYCPAVAIGSVVGAWYQPEFAGFIIGKTQQQWSRSAAQLSCAPNPAAQAAAVGLIAACQCHNKAAADWVISHPAATLKVLREFAKCSVRGNIAAAAGVADVIVPPVTALPQNPTGAATMTPVPISARACSVAQVEQSCALATGQPIGVPCACTHSGKTFAGVTE